MTVIDIRTVRKCRCRHPHIEVDEDTETVECADCGAQLTPFNVLLRLSKGQDQKRYTEKEYQRLTVEIKSAKEELERLKKSIRYYKTKGDKQ